ncbi:MAG: baseplate J/gp47 family protein [Sandaracinaceae bacterium]
MPFARPTLRTLIDRFRADIRAKTEGGDALLRRSVETVLARAVPGLTHGLHGHLAWVARQLLPDRSEDDQVLRWAALLGMSLRPAEAAVSDAAEFSTLAATIPVGTLVQRNDGVRYLTTSESNVAGVVTVGLVAEEPGLAGNADAGTAVSLISPIGGVTTVGVITDPDGAHDGTDLETIEQLRVRVLQRLANPPRGGSRGDYVRWALEVPGVTRVWETARIQGAGTVGVQFVTDDELGGPIPTAAKVTEVTAYLEERAPTTLGRAIGGVYVGLVVSAPTAYPIDPEIQVTPDTPAVRAAVEAELLDFLRREAEPGVTIPLSRFEEAISRAEGEESHVLVSPVAAITPATGELPILGTITWS